MSAVMRAALYRSGAQRTLKTVYSGPARIPAKAHAAAAHGSVIRTASAKVSLCRP